MAVDGLQAHAGLFAKSCAQLIEQLRAFGRVTPMTGCADTRHLTGQVWKQCGGLAYPGAQTFCLQADAEYIFGQFGLGQLEFRYAEKSACLLSGARKANRHVDSGVDSMGSEGPVDRFGAQLMTDQPFTEGFQQSCHGPLQCCLVTQWFEQVQGLRKLLSWSDVCPWIW